MITALKLLLTAQANGWSFKVMCDEEVDYQGASARAAWNAVKATEEAQVIFYDRNMIRLGWAFMSAHGLADDETLIDYSDSKTSPFTALCDKLIEESV